jgi:putative colanic acid biosynthesis UDP-glucose lipid carrier transferase
MVACLVRFLAEPRTVTGVSIDECCRGPAINMPRDLPESWMDDGAFAVDPSLRRAACDPIKRLIDIVGAGLGLIVLSPLLLMVAAAIMLESPGLPVFCQRRTGYRGRTFVIYKFRSMRVCEDGANIVQAVRDDDRITNVGRLLRRSSIDELPQLVNVVKGEMSLVGPRPHALAHDTYYGEQIAGYDHRFMAKPGLTGLAQVCGLRGRTEDVASMAARIEKDLEYISSWSLFLDIKILFRTVLIFAFHPAAY